MRKTRSIPRWNPSIDRIQSRRIQRCRSKRNDSSTPRGYPGSESITLSQSKGVFSYAQTSWFGKVTGKTCTKSEYSAWRISVAATDGSHSYSRTWKNGSIKLLLKSNRTYKITVSYDSYQDTFRGLNYRNFRWTRYPSWRIASTWKVSEYN